MGAIFAERVLGVDRPRVALLSIGEEKGKGDARIQRATELLDESGLRFEGNVEGKDLTRHLADVVVCDAVLGNVVIKFFEGLSTFIFDLWRDEFRRSLRGRLAYLLLRSGIARIRSVFDYETVGRIAAAGRARHGHHHPRPGPSPDDRRMPARSPPRRPGTACRRSSPRPWPPRRAQPRSGRRPGSPHRERAAPVDRTRRDRRARSTGRLRGPRRRPRRPGGSVVAARPRRSRCDGQVRGRPRPRPAVGRRPARPRTRRAHGPGPLGGRRPRSNASLVSSSVPSPCIVDGVGADRVRGRRTGRRLALAAVFEADFGQRTADAVLERHLAERSATRPPPSWPANWWPA